MRRVAVPLSVLLALLLGACSGSDSDAGSVPTSSSGAPSPSSTPSPTPSGTVGSLGGDRCFTQALTRAPTDATPAFPDNPDVTWTAEGATPGADGRALVELVPDPDEVGYPRFRFVYDCATGEPVRFGTYAFEDGGWILLSTTDAGASADLPVSLP